MDNNVFLRTARPDEVFDRLPAFTYALWIDDGTIQSRPNVTSVVELIQCVADDAEYSGPFPDSVFRNALAEANSRREDIIRVVQEQIATLRESGRRFVLLWHAYGDEKWHYDHSEDYSSWQETVEEFADDIGQRIVVRAAC